MLNEEYVFRGKKFDVKILRVSLPNGRIAVKEVVAYPGAALILPISDEGKIVLIRQYRAVVDKWLYELPAGTLEPDENPMECALRELEEETGYKAGRLDLLFKAYTAPGYSTELIHFYLARDLRKGEVHPDSDEVIKVEEKSLGEVLEMIRDGRIIDMKTIAAILYYVNFHNG